METSYFSRPIPLRVILLLALAIHGPLLAMQLPLTNSYDANFHIFFASHYAHSWFNPWNPKWFAGFSQTTYPPLAHQWIALLSFIFGLHAAYLLVQLVAILLVPVGIYRYARLWVSERASSYAALFSVFLGALAFLVYNAGQLPTTLSAPLFLLAIPYFYDWSRAADGRALLKGVVLTLAAGAVHHVTLIFVSLLFAIPVLWLAVIDREERKAGAVIVRGIVFGILAGIGLGIVLLPYWLSIIQHPIQQMPIPHASRSNLLLNLTFLTNYFLVPYGMLIIALPLIAVYGSANRRLRPLLIGFWITFIFGLGGTTPLPKWLLGRAYEILTFERFTLAACFMALPIIGLIAERMLDRRPRRAAAVFAMGAIITLAWPMAWIGLSPFSANANLNTDSVDAFLNRDNHDRYRYLTLGFGNSLPKVSTYTDANSVDGEYNSARLLPEFTHYGTAQLTSAKYFGTAGMEALRMMLRHASHYGLKYIFIHDPFYEPLVSFAGWQKVETYDSGAITVWSREDIPPARPIPSDAMPTALEGLLWGTLPLASSLLAILFAFTIPDRRRMRTPDVLLPFPTHDEEGMLVREAK
ncbi:MAG TPA: 6-pyruvoyl-tetrahydropterin synthase-related protein [Terriglobales bacterium]|nr:6-pyruvoyl-tetrahydropterin synthase-related protein [Terriglobales bacterium]